MNAILISYDLIAPGKDYADLHKAIKDIGTWWHCLESVWIVKTNLTATQVRDTLAVHIDGNDKLVALNLSGGWATQHLSKECNDWLRNNL